MAECKETTVSTNVYTLTLSEEEAKFLARLLGNHIKGVGKRYYSDSIWAALPANLDFKGKPLEVDIGYGDLIYIKEEL